MKPTKRIRTVLYGDQRLSSAELEILHTPAMQRLYGLRQLGLTDRIFIDASHSRIHHVVGVLEQVDKLVSAIVKNLEQNDRVIQIGSSKEDKQKFSAKELAVLVHKRKPVVRFIGLLHDLTHAPFGHTVEDEIRLVESKHDEPERQADAFYRLLCQLIAWLSLEANGPEFQELPRELKPFLAQAATSKLPSPTEVGNLARRLLSGVAGPEAEAPWRLSRSEIAELFAHLRCAMTALLHLEALHNAEPSPRQSPKLNEYEFQAAIRMALSGGDFEALLTDFDFAPSRDAFMLDIVGNTVCADLLDYAQRDSHFSGLKLDYDSDRIAENFTLVGFDIFKYEKTHLPQTRRSEGDNASEGSKNPFGGSCIRTAISLVSHKYRTDVPSELMNLLNVRFYLYERVIYHPTKCAAGSMLGTALQLLGWRASKDGPGPTLPNHLRFVGDDVFLHDIRAALEFDLLWMDSIPADTVISEQAVAELRNMDCIHNGLAQIFLELRIGQTVSAAQRELGAARLMLDRLAARRYFRPVFRALPSTNNEKLQAGADELAGIFRRPDVRYEAERKIESRCGLPLGTVTIHCPNRTTAKKIANVLLTKPMNGTEKVCKLNDISLLDSQIFGQHQKAVHAVEEMYLSMWRLMAYVAPEHILKFKEIGEIAGRVIAETLDTLGELPPGVAWENDPHLAQELERKVAPKIDRRAPAPAVSGTFGTVIGETVDQLIKSGRLKNAPAEYLGNTGAIPFSLRLKIEAALASAFEADRPQSKLNTVAADKRADALLRLFKTYSQKITKKASDEFISSYSGPLGKLNAAAFDEIYHTLDGRILETNNIEKLGEFKHSGYKFRELQDVLNELLKKHRVALPSPSRGKLF